MSTKLKSLLFIAVFVFASTAYAPRVFADTQPTYTITTTGRVQGYVQSEIVSYVGSTIRSYRTCRGTYPTCTSSISSTSNSSSVTTSIFPTNFSNTNNGFSGGWQNGAGNTSTTGNYWTQVCDTINYGGNCIYFLANWNGSIWTGGFTSVYTSTTHIISVTPAGGATVATSTTFAFGVTGYITTDDYTNGLTQVQVNLDYSQSAGAHWYSPTAVPSCITGLIPNTNICGSYVFPITSSGYFSFSTTTILTDETGRYNMDTRIRHPLFYILSQDVAATSTQFTVVASSGLDLLHDRITTTVNNLTASSTLDLSSCNLLGAFDPATCAYSLLIPPTETLANDFTVFKEGALSRVPFGYLTRLTVILSSTAAVEPPALTYKFGTSSPAVLQSLTASDPISFQIWDHMSEFNSIKTDDGTNKGIWDIVMPYFNLVIYVAFFFAVLSDLIGFEFRHDGTQEHDPMGATGAKRFDNKGHIYTEWSTSDIQKAIDKGNRSNGDKS